MKEFLKLQRFSYSMSNTRPYPSVVDRYFTKYFFKGQNNGNTCVLAHSNRVCVITLAPDHPILLEGPVKEVSFNPKGKDFHLSNRIHGKKKKGAIKVSPFTIICALTSANGNTYNIQCGVKGSLMEMNENLLNNPTLITEKRETNGYIGIVHHNFHEELNNHLLTEEQYVKDEMAVLNDHKITDD